MNFPQPTIPAGRFLPSGQSQILFGINGGGIVDASGNGNDGSLTGGHCVKFSDTGTVAGTSYAPSVADFRAVLRVRRLSAVINSFVSKLLTTGNQRSFNLSTTAAGVLQFGYSTTGATTTTVTTSKTLTVGVDYLIDLRIVSGVVTLKVDGETVYQSGVLTIFDSTANIYFSGHATSGNGGFAMWDAKIYTGTTLQAWYPCAGGSGNTLYDVTGNARHAAKAGAGASFDWTETQNDFHYNLTHGFRLSSGVKIPALYDGSTAANGSAITNRRSAGHNGAESVVNFNYGGLPTWAYGAALPTGVSADIVNGYYFNLRNAL
jgi:hypothetical protein